MRPAGIRLVAACLLATSVASCARDAGNGEAGRSTEPPSAPQVAPAPYEQIGGIEDTSYRELRPEYAHVTIRIAIPPGHTPEEMRETLRRVAESTARDEKASVVLVFAYRSRDDVAGPANIGRALYTAPRHHWAPATTAEVDLFPADPSAKQGSPQPGITAFRRTYGKRWPFPGHDSAVVNCDLAVFRGVTRPLVTIELGGKRYGLTRTAVEIGGFTDATPLIKESPEFFDKVVREMLGSISGELSSLGNGLCRTEPDSRAAEVERVADDTIAFPGVPNVSSFDTDYYAMPGYHLVAWDHGEAGSTALFRAAVSDVQVIDALERLGAKPGNALDLDTWDQRDDLASRAPEKIIQGPPVDVLVRVPGHPDPLTLDQILVDEEGRGFDMRFGGHRRNIDAWHPGCIVCLYSCPASKIGNAHYTVRDYARKARISGSVQTSSPGARTR